MHPAFQQFHDLLKNRDYEGLKSLLSSQFNVKELAIAQCVTCGQVLGLAEYPAALVEGIRGNDKQLQLLVFKHLQEHQDHEVVLKTSIKDYPLGEMYLNALQIAADRFGITLESAFRQRIPFLEKEINQ